MPLNRPFGSWQGRYVWIIGASSGIGAALARELIASGAHVAVSARRPDALRQVAGGSPDALVLPLDVTEPASVLAAHGVLRQHWPWLHMVVLVAGSYQPMRADQLDIRAAEELIDLNLRSVYRCLDVVLPGMLRQGSGGIAIVSSVAGYSGLPRALVYGPTKAALINLCESLYCDLHQKGLDVYMINPGFVATPLTARNDFPMPALMQPEAAAQRIARGMEKGRFHIHFPRRFTNLLRFARLLPYGLYFRLIRKVTGL
ncbi:SDR family NAD(P)-dependent oxidoreductase [Massilia sp. SM-13]|uniref:SDR family NAD(P)-dependent oxidoreductase n=1 Tax=Pseudoduganella rhizocola TaxID=3382643 RepID=UPI0038B5CD09